MTFKIMLPILGNIIFIENFVVFMLLWEVSHQNISRFTANICWLGFSSYERDVLCF